MRRVYYLIPILVLFALTMGRASPHVSAYQTQPIAAIWANCHGFVTIQVSNPQTGNEAWVALSVFNGSSFVATGQSIGWKLQEGVTEYSDYININVVAPGSLVRIEDWVSKTMSSEFIVPCEIPPTKTPVPPTSTPVPPTETPVPPTPTQPTTGTKTPVQPTQPPGVTSTPIPGQPPTQVTSQPTTPPGEVVIQLPDTGTKPPSNNSYQHLLGVVILMAMISTGIYGSWLRRNRIRS